MSNIVVRSFMMRTKNMTQKPKRVKMKKLDLSAAALPNDLALVALRLARSQISPVKKLKIRSQRFKKVQKQLLGPPDPSNWVRLLKTMTVQVQVMTKVMKDR